MNLPRFALTHRSIVFAFLAVFLCVGLFNFSSMSRREDPEITIRDTLVITAWPGAPADRIEELITDPLEKVITQITEVDIIESKSMVGLSVIQIAVDDRVTNTDQVWDEIRAKVSTVQSKLPLGSQPPFVNSDFGDVYEIVIALHQVPLDGQQDIEYLYSPREFEIFAERIEDELELIDSVTKVEFWGVQHERIYVEVDSADWAKINLTASQLRQVFEARNIVQPGGELDTELARYAINPTGEFTSVSQMNDLVVSRVDGNLPVRLGDLPITIDRRYEEPSKSLTRFTTPELPHNSTLVLGISMKSGQNVTKMSIEVNKVLNRLRESYLPPDIKLTRVNDLPRQVNTRIHAFQINLLQGMTIVLGLALIIMGWRPALIMTVAIPISMICAFAVVRYLGIELEQFSIASLIIALGMVVDNAIVVTDNAVRLIREGMPKTEAVIKGTQDLAIPILTSTLTTIFAFLPMLTMVGDVGEYVGSLPVVVPATLVASFFVAMLVTPIMCVWLLRGNATEDVVKDTGNTIDIPRYDRVMGWCLDHKAIVLSSSLVLFIDSLGIIPVIGNQFFPSGSRDQFFIKIWLPEGSPIAATSQVAEQVEKILVETSPVMESGESKQRLANVITFVGTGGSRLMVTQEPEYDYPYYAFLLVNMTDHKYTEDYAREIRKNLRLE
ncbi:MAG: efflux RND transporter permease subunit, partial [Gammaproteobacteria bacterium]